LDFFDILLGILGFCLFWSSFSSRPEFDHSSALAGEFDPSNSITVLREKYLKLRFQHFQPVVSLAKSFWIVQLRICILALKSQYCPFPRQLRPAVLSEDVIAVHSKNCQVIVSAPDRPLNPKYWGQS
jgi:hypothetical protein